METIKIHSEMPPKCDADAFYVVGTLHPAPFTEGRVEDADYIAHVLWVPQTNKLIFKIWDKDGAYSSWN